MVFWAWQLEKHLNLTCSLNEYNLGCGGGWEKRKMNRELCEIRQFQFTGLWVNLFQFQFMQVSLLWREILTFRLKEAKRSWNHIIWRTFKLNQGEERGGKGAPASFQFLLQNLPPGSPPGFWFLVHLPPRQIQIELWTHISMYLAYPGGPLPDPRPDLGEQRQSAREGQGLPERPVCPQMSLC